MKWNWQQPDWPRLSWSPDRLAKAEEQFLVGGGVIMGAVSHLDGESRDRLTVEAMSEEAVTSSEIAELLGLKQNRTLSLSRARTKPPPPRLSRQCRDPMTCSPNLPRVATRASRRRALSLPGPRRTPRP